MFEEEYDDMINWSQSDIPITENATPDDDTEDGGNILSSPKLEKINAVHAFNNMIR